MDGGSPTDFTTANILLLPKQPNPKPGDVLFGKIVIKVVEITDWLPGGMRLAACILSR